MMRVVYWNQKCEYQIRYFRLIHPGLKQLCTVLLFTCLFLVIGHTSLAQASLAKNYNPSTTPLAISKVSELEGLDDFIMEQMSEWKTPGLALAVVKDGNVIYIKGYGYRDVEKHLPVTSKTLFPIGSITKSFAAVSLGILDDKGIIDWDKPVREYMSGFQMYDQVSTERLTMRDLMSHRTGLPGQDFFMYYCGFTKKEMFDRLRYLEPIKDLRTTFQYSNLMVMIAGYIAGEVSDLGWENLTDQTVLSPLEMQTTNFSAPLTQKSGNFALGYRLLDGEVNRVRNLMLDFKEEGAAGVINSNVTDMSHFLIFLLNQGSYNGVQVLSKENAEEIQTPQIPWTKDVPGGLNFDEFGYLNYGLGLAMTTYRGHQLVEHGGGFAGFSAQMSMLPKEHIGVVVLTNLSQTDITTIVKSRVLDQLLGLQPIDWSGRFRKLTNKSIDVEAVNQKLVIEGQAAPPTHKLTEYTGSYHNPGYGNLQIGLDKNNLRISNRVISAPLEHVDGDYFSFRPDLRYSKWQIPLGFETGADGTIISLHSRVVSEGNEIRFIRCHR